MISGFLLSLLIDPDVAKSIAEKPMIVCGASDVRIAIRWERGHIEQALSFGRAVEQTLLDERGWRRAGIDFCWSDGPPDIEISLASPARTDELCYPIATYGQVSCAIGPRVTINEKRWREATRAWDDIEDYRRYVINHEVGHALDMPHRYNCTKSGRAPLMMQQSRDKKRCDAPGIWPTANEILTLKKKRGGSAHGEKEKK